MPPPLAEPADAPAPRARARGRRSPLAVHYTDGSPLAVAIDQLEATLGGRDKLIDALVGLPDAAGLDYVVGLFADPRSDCRKLSELCRAGGVSVGEVLEAVKRGLLLAPTLQAMRTVAEKLPPVVEDVMLRAAPHHIPCGACAGLTTVAGATIDSPPVPCPTCRGLGTTLILPDLDRQKVALDLARLLPKAGPAISTVIDNRRQTAIGGSLSDLIKATDQVALRPPAPPASQVEDAAEAASGPEEPS